MKDLFNSLLFSSDPFISSLSKSNSAVRSYREPLDKNVIQLLSDPALPDFSVAPETSDESNEEYSDIE